MRNFSKLALFGVLSATLLLSACSATNSDPDVTPTEKASAASTLEGTVSSRGISITEVNLDDIDAKPSETSALSKAGFNSVLFESGGSSSKDCQSNFTKITFVDNAVNMSHRTGNGEMSPCTMDYQQKFFLIEGDEPFPEDTTFNVLDENGDVIISYNLKGELISE